jgi:hypothetical protein
VFDVSLVVFVSCNVVVLYYVLPAYEQTKNRGFMWLTFSSLLSIFNSAGGYFRQGDCLSQPALGVNVT